MFNQNDFGEDLLDLNDLLEREEAILDNTDTPGDDDWTFLQGMKELKEQFYGDISDHANNEPTLINKDYKAGYAEEYATEISSIDTSDWPLSCIDWDNAADELFGYDWTEYTIGEYTYLGRNF